MKINLTILLICLFLFGCQSSLMQSTNKSLELENKSLVNNTTQNPEVAYLIKEGLDYVQENELEKASKTFNLALQLDMTNSHLQFLNANTYHLLALTKDSGYFDLAIEGYQLSTNFDNTNWYPLYYLGLLHLDKKEYDLAQDLFADALLYNNEEPDIVYNFIVASYYAQDPISAAGGVEQLKILEPNSERLAKAASIVYASLNEQDEAKVWLSALSHQTDIEDNTFTRVQDWSDFYQQLLKDNTINVLEKKKRIGEDDEDDEDDTDEYEEDADEYNDSSSNDTKEPLSADVTFAEDEDMLIADIVIVASEDKQTDSRGVNILDGLTLQLGDGTDAAVNITQTGTNESNGTMTITRRLTIPYITYTLNIINAKTEKSEILARPSLVASEGIESTFFAGENIIAGAASTGSNAKPIQVDLDLGVQLNITPTNLEKDLVELTVLVERTSLKSTSSNVSFTYQVRQAKTNVQASVKMRRGDTLILSGLSEKETETIRNGVPLLEDIPIIQYFFSRRVDTDFNKSVLVLITPRLPQYTYRSRETRIDIAQQRGEDESFILKELKGRYSDWFKPYPNWTSVYSQLQQNSLYREFRTGDVKFDKWDSQITHSERLKNIFKFLYY